MTQPRGEAVAKIEAAAGCLLDIVLSLSHASRPPAILSISVCVCVLTPRAAPS